MVARLPIALSMTSAFIFTYDVLAFTSSPMSSCLRSCASSRTHHLSMTSSFFADATESKTPKEVVQMDANGKAFAEGAEVAITSPNHIVKAYHVPKSAYGSFDPNNRGFIPQDESNVTRSTSCLVLPTGLRGVIEKIYNTNEWDRAHPILVKFEAGSDRESGEGFNVPTSFKMHFDADEIEVMDL